MNKISDRIMPSSKWRHRGGLLRINERGIASYQIGGLTFKTQRKFLNKNHNW